MPTMVQIAKKAGVSPAVVSRVIGNDGTLRISPETRERVEAAIREMNYAPNVAAQSLASSRSGTIAVIVHDIANPVYGEIMRGAQAEAARQQKAIILGDASAGAASDTRLAQMISGGGVDGLILQAAGEVSDEHIAGAARKGVPIVLLQANMDVDAHLVQLPDEQATVLATQHLIDLGHSRIGCLATEEGLTFTNARLAGWYKAMATRARADCVVFSAPNPEAGETVMREFLERRPGISGLVCFNVVAAVGALRIAREKGLSVPGDLSIVAIHDFKFAQDLWVPLTVVSMPLREMGQLAVKTVCTPPPEAKTSHQLETKPRLVIRQSTAPPRR